MTNLDKQVAEALGLNYRIWDNGVIATQRGNSWDFWPFSPSTNWSQGGPLIEEYGMDVRICDEADGKYIWEAALLGDRWAGIGETPLIAAMKALVASREQNKPTE